MPDPFRRLDDLIGGPLAPDDRAWLLSPSGLVAACQGIVGSGDLGLLERLETGPLWSRLIDASPHPLGQSLARRGRAIVAAARLACTAGPDPIDADDALLDAVANGFASEPSSEPDAPGPFDGAVRTRVAAADLLRWLRGSNRPAPRAVRRVTFLVDEHTHGRTVRLTLAQFPHLSGFGPDVVSNPFTVVDDAFDSALADAREASGSSLDGVRWSVTWETGEVPTELQGRSVGLAALVCFDRLVQTHQLGVETSWAFTGAVGRDGRIVSCLDDGGVRSYANKLRAAEQRNVVVPSDDFVRAKELADAGALGVKLHAAGDVADVIALLDARKPTWLSTDHAPVVGRGSELGTLAALADSAIADGPKVTCLTGEPGIGKSRLAREFGTQLLADHWRVAWGACYEAEATVAYRPAVAVVRSLLRWFDDTDDVIGDSRPDLALLLPELDEAGARRRRAVVSSERQLALFDAVARLVRRAADVHPLAIVVEDVHWADRPSLLLLAHIVRQCGGSPVVLLVSYRDTEVSDDHAVTHWLADVRATRPTEEIHLGGLDEDEVGELLTQLNGRQPPTDFTNSMLTVTQGNPLFVHELARHAQDTGALNPRRDRWSFDTDDTPLPAGLRDVLARRVRTLPPDAQLLLRYVAASPGGSSFDVLCAATGIDHIVLLDALDRAVDAGVLHEQARDGSGFIYEFSHVLFRQVLNRQATAARRASYHLALAQALSARPDPLERWTGEIGYHFHRAGRLGDPPAALRTCRRAGELAMANTAYDDAATQFGRAIEAAGWSAGVSAGVVAELELLQAEASHRAGDSTSRRELAERSFARAGREADALTMAGAALVHGGARSTYGLASQTTMTMLTEALAALEPAGSTDPALQARLMSRLAQETYHVQQFEEAKAMSAAALDLVVHEAAPGVRAAVLDGRAWTLHTPDDLRERLDLADEMVREAVQARDPEWEMMGRSWRCTALLELGDIVGIDAELARFDVLATEAPVPSHLFRVATLRCTRAMMAGDFGAGAELAQEAFRIGTPIEPENAVQTFCAQMLGMCREQGLLVGLVDTAEQMAADFPMVPGWRCALAFVNLEAGLTERAHALFDGLAGNGFRDVPRDLAWMQAHSYLAELAAVFEDRRAAAILYKLLKPFSGRNVGLYDIASNGAVDYFLGVLAATMDRRTTAIRHLHRAVAFNDGSAQRPAAARSRVALAKLLQAGDERDRAEADALVRTASAVAADLGLFRLAAEIEPVTSRST